MIEHPDDFTPADIANAPWGGGEPDPVDIPRPQWLPDPLIEDFDADETEAFDEAEDLILADQPYERHDKDFWRAGRAYEAQLQADEARFARLAEDTYDDYQEQLRAQDNPLQALVYTLMSEGVDAAEIVGMPKNLGDDRIAEIELWFEGVLMRAEGTVLRFKVDAAIGRGPDEPPMYLTDDLELASDVVPMTPEFAAASGAALREHLLRRAGLIEGEAATMKLDHDGNPIPEVQP